MSITPAMVKELRETTGAGMMDCKKALIESEGVMDAAIDWLRTKGLSAVAKKASRVAAEGLVGVASMGTVAGIIEVNSETDFVARNDTFQGFVRAAAEIVAHNVTEVAALKNKPFPGSERTVGDELTHMIAVIGENMNIRRAHVLSVDTGVVATYVHNAIAEGIGKIGVLVALESTANTAALEDLGRQIAMHIAATRPEAATVAELSEDFIAREKQIFIEQARESGKPDTIIEKMIEGRMRKFYEEVVLVEQSFVMNPDKRVKEVLTDASKDLGAPVALSGFVRFTLGEGIEKKEEDFAAEVAAQLGS
ncbi:MAG: elongation factor Ts [Alphaproteobacteria bacterium]|nr:MAG: elongation factor Ts [Alphaproteobacteria bacterium]